MQYNRQQQCSKNGNNSTVILLKPGTLHRDY